MPQAAGIFKINCHYKPLVYITRPVSAASCLVAWASSIELLWVLQYPSSVHSLASQAVGIFKINCRYKPLDYLTRPVSVASCLVAWVSSIELLWVLQYPSSVHSLASQDTIAPPAPPNPSPEETGWLGAKHRVQLIPKSIVATISLLWLLSWTYRLFVV